MIAGIEVWALPVNTALLIVLAMTNSIIARHQRRERNDVSDLKRSLGLTKRDSDDPLIHLGTRDTGERRRATDREKEVP